jgi:hypothetical protein
MCIERTIHDAHAALIELGIDPIVTERLADHSGSLMRRLTAPFAQRLLSAAFQSRAADYGSAKM